VLVSGSKSFAVSTTQVGGTTHILAGVDGQDVTSNLTGGDLGGFCRRATSNCRVTRARSIAWPSALELR
jgi:hypothetical protein